MRRSLTNIIPKIIHFDELDFSGHHSKKYVSFDAQCTLLKSDITRRDHVYVVNGCVLCGSRFVKLLCQFHTGNPQNSHNSEIPISTKSGAHAQW